MMKEEIISIPVHKCKILTWLSEEKDICDYVRLQESIGRYGITEPCLVRVSGDSYEVINGKDRIAVAQQLGLEEVPAIVKQLTTAEARGEIINDIVNTRRFNSLSSSDKAEVIKEFVQQSKCSYGSKSSSLDCKRCGEKLNSVKACSQKFGISERTVSRYLRVYELCDEWRTELSKGVIALRTAVELSYIDKELQKIIWESSIPTRYLSYQEAHALRLKYCSKNL